MCSSTSNDKDIRMFHFPKYGSDRFYLWLKETHLQLDKKNYFLCSLQFKPHDIGARLSKLAVPSQNLGYVKSPRPLLQRTSTYGMLTSPQRTLTSSDREALPPPPFRTYGKSPFLLDDNFLSTYKPSPTKTARIDNDFEGISAEYLRTPEKSRRELFVKMRSCSPDVIFCNECLKKEKSVALNTISY